MGGMVAQSDRTHSPAGDPPVRLWLSSHGDYEHGDRAKVHAQAAQDGYLVVLHAGWKFNGLAGVLTLVTIVVVISGVIGRYIYTAVPRTLVNATTGWLVERLGWFDFYLLCTALAVPGMVLLWWVAPWNDESDAAAKPAARVAGA